MPRLVRSPAEKEIAAEIRQEQKRINAEKRARKKGYAIKRGKNERLRGPGVGLLRAVVGSAVVSSALDNFGADLVRRAATALNSVRRETQARRVKSIARVRARLQEGGLSDEDISRYKAWVFLRVRAPERRFLRLRSGPYAYKRQTLTRGRYRDDGKKYKTIPGVRSAKIAYERLRHRAQIAQALGISLNRATVLVQDVQKKAVSDLEAFRKTKHYRDMPPRWKKGVTEKRWKAASVAALYQLMDVDGYEG